MKEIYIYRSLMFKNMKVDGISYSQTTEGQREYAKLRKSPDWKEYRERMRSDPEYKTKVKSLRRHMRYNNKTYEELYNIINDDRLKSMLEEYGGDSIMKALKWNERRV